MVGGGLCVHVARVLERTSPAPPEYEPATAGRSTTFFRYARTRGSTQMVPAPATCSQPTHAPNPQHRSRARGLSGGRPASYAQRMHPSVNAVRRSLLVLVVAAACAVPVVAAADSPPPGATAR